MSVFLKTKLCKGDWSRHVAQHKKKLISERNQCRLFLIYFYFFIYQFKIERTENQGKTNNSPYSVPSLLVSLLRCSFWLCLLKITKKLTITVWKRQKKKKEDSPLGVSHNLNAANNNLSFIYANLQTSFIDSDGQGDHQNNYFCLCEQSQWELSQKS